MTTQFLPITLICVIILNVTLYLKGINYFWSFLYGDRVRGIYKNKIFIVLFGYLNDNEIFKLNFENAVIEFSILI